MNRFLLSLPAMAALASAASAHPSLVEHAHPHGTSALLGLDVLIGAVVAVALGAGALAVIRRRR